MPIGLIEALPSLFGFGGSSSSAPAATSAAPDNSKAIAATQEKEAIARQAPDIQAQLGGAVAPDYYADLAAKNAGFVGDTNQARNALSPFFGGDASLTGPASTPPTQQSGGKSIFEELIARQGGDDDKGVSGGFGA